MSAPTPRTDAQAGWAIADYGYSTAPQLLGDPEGTFVHAAFARTLERELAESRNAERLARVQLAAEREKVAALRLACERLRDCDWVISLPDRMDAVRDIAREALAATQAAP